MKKKLLKWIVLIAVITVIQSCNTRFIVIEGYNNDYGLLNDSLKSLIHPLNSFDSLNEGEVYPINPELLKAELKKHPKSIVRLYSNGCNSLTCKPISSYKHFADENGCVIFMIMVSYSAMQQSIEQHPDVPLFVIDNYYYKEERRFIYERYFLNDLIGYPTKTKYKDIPDELQKASLFMYEYGHLVGTLQSLPE